MVILPPGMSESDFMRGIGTASGWNNWLWIPWVNDCHSDLENAFIETGVPYPGAPNGRIDIDDDIGNCLNKCIRQLDQFIKPENLFRRYGGN